MRKSLKILSFFCAMLLATSALMGGCRKKEEEETGGHRVEGALRQYNITETDYFIMKDGVTNYKIVIPENAGDTVKFAAKELNYFFYDATGKELEVITDKDISFTQDATYLSVGKTKLLQEAGVDVSEEELGSQGLRIATKGKTVFMASAGEADKQYGEEGTLYAVYEFLHQTLGYDMFYNDCYSLKKNVTEILLMNYDIKDVPDIEYRSANYAYVWESEETMRRMRSINRGNLFIPVNGYGGHNELQYVNPDVYLEDHPLWYDNAVDPQRLCYTAHGDEKELNAMLEACLETAKTALKDERYLNMDILVFALEDTQAMCVCEACKASKVKYGADSGAAIVFLKKLKVLVDNWFATEDGKPYAREGGIKFCFYAYHGYNTAPAVYDEEADTYVASSPDVICGDDIVVAIAPVFADYTRSLYDDANKQYLQQIRAWSEISNKKYFYYYSTNYKYFLTPYNTFNSMQENYQLVRELGGFLIYNLGQQFQKNYATGWSTLKVYLESKVGWDVNADVEAYTDKFFDNYFGEASDIMRNIYNEYRAHTVYMEDVVGYKGSRSMYYNALDKNLWPQSLLESWNSQIDDALAAIEDVKEEDPLRYESLYNHIICERVSYNYLLASLYTVNYTNSELMAIRREFADDVNRLGMTHVAESTSSNDSIATLLKNWGVA